MRIDYDHWDFSAREQLMIAVCSVAAGIGTGYLFYDDVRAGVPLCLVFFLFRAQYRGFLIEKRRDELLLQFRDLLYSIASSVSVGRNMTQALEESVHFWENTYSDSDYIMQELKSMLRQIKEGNERDVVVLRDLAVRSGLTDIEDFVAVYESCRDSGADLIKAIDKASSMIGDKINMEKELHTLMSQKQFEGRLITAAPFALLLFLRMTAPDYLAPLTQSVSGYVLVTLTLGLIGAAYLWTERINHIEV